MRGTAVVGVTGGIAAYKTAYLVSALVKEGWDVHVLMTRNAAQFVGPPTFETLSGNAVLIDTFDRKGAYDVEHVSLAKRADVIVVAPATANILAKAAAGLADDMLTTTLLAAACPVIFAPAMNGAMYVDAATQDNIALLVQRGYYVMETGEGRLACGDISEGRMKEPDEILAYVHEVLGTLRDMHGIRVLVSAGPTREMLDPVRYLSNRSSGKMGYAIAQAAANRGADVTLVSGPVALPAVPKAAMVGVVSAAQMAERMLTLADSADIIVMAAAVADYTPRTCSTHKMKKGADIELKLVRTQDILQELGAHKRPGQLLMGFAAETQNFEENAKQKLAAKNLDIIALNDVSRQGEGFDADHNNIILYGRDGSMMDLGSAGKKTLAKHIVAALLALYRQIRAR